MASLHDLRLRASPRWEIVVVDRLSPGELAALREHDRDTVYGVLRERKGCTAARPVGRELALLFLVLREPGLVPRSAVADLGEEAIAALVLDGILEVEHNGVFVGGPAATELIAGPDAARSATSRPAELSIDALRYGEQLAGLSSEELGLRLYAFGRKPVSPVIRRRLRDAEALEAFLGLAPDGPLRRRLEASWRAVPGSGEWKVWRSRAPARRSSVEGAARFKLYVSPAWEHLPQALDAVVAYASGSSGARAFKIAATQESFSRPDKLVAYFDSLEELRAVAGRLADERGNWTAHGVPFTAAVTSDGLLSWGLDPPRASGLGSWREWLTHRLAVHLNDGRSAPAGAVELWRYAIERIRLEGVDPETWSPASELTHARPA
jgi:hypothetical protein